VRHSGHRWPIHDRHSIIANIQKMDLTLCIGLGLLFIMCLIFEQTKYLLFNLIAVKQK